MAQIEEQKGPEYAAISGSFGWNKTVPRDPNQKSIGNGTKKSIQIENSHSNPRVPPLANQHPIIEGEIPLYVAPNANY